MPYQFRPGMRVQLKPHLDLWMQGARYAELRRYPVAKVFGDTPPEFVGRAWFKMDQPSIRKLQLLRLVDVEPADIAAYRKALRDAIGIDSQDWIDVRWNDDPKYWDAILINFFNMANAEGYPLLSDAARVYMQRHGGKSLRVWAEMIANNGE